MAQKKLPIRVVLDFTISHRTAKQLFDLKLDKDNWVIYPSGSTEMDYTKEKDVKYESVLENLESYGFITTNVTSWGMETHTYVLTALGKQTRKVLKGVV